MSQTQFVTHVTNLVHQDALVVDVHVHGAAFLPQPVRTLYRVANRRTIPADVPLDALGKAGVDAVVLKAVGDPIVTRWFRGRAWDAVRIQLDQLTEQATRAGARLARTTDDVRQAHQQQRLAVVLGLEGADGVGREPARLDELYDRGVRVVVLVHMTDNALGTTCLPWLQYAGPIPVRRPAPRGLTPLGADIVGRMNELGMVIDLAHADHPTVMGVVEASRAPVISSHTGARVRQDFERFLTDEEIRAIASTGGLMGLWPYRRRGKGVNDVGDLVGHARHIAAVAGPDHLCIGTDMNGVPGVMDGYRGERDLPVVTAALLEGGFSEDEVRGILGQNFLATLARVTGS